MENRAIRFLNKFKPTYYLNGLILIALTDHWIYKFRNQTIYPDIGYVTKFFPTEVTSFIGILIALRCFSLSRHGMVKCVASISIFTLLDFTACSVEYLKAIIGPTCFVLQAVLIACRSYQFYREATNLNILRISAVIIGFLKLLEILGYQLYFNKHVTIVYLIAIMLPEGIIPTLTQRERSTLMSLNLMSVIYVRLHILKAFPFFSIYWLLFRLFKLINHDETGNVWDKVLGPRLESAFEVFAMVCVISLIALFVSEWLFGYLFQSIILFRNAPFLLMISCQQFLFLMDDGIWNMEREQQWKVIRSTLFIPLIHILCVLVYLSKTFLDRQLLLGLSKEYARVFARGSSLCIICPSLIIVWMCVWTDEFNAARSLFIAFLVFHLFGTAILWTLNVLYIGYNPDCGAKHCELFYRNLFFCLENFFTITMIFIKTMVQFYIALSVLQVPGFFRIYDILTCIWELWNRWKQIRPVQAKVWRISRFIYGLREVRGNEIVIEKHGVCPICREEMNVACITHCNHYYHPYCLENVLYNFNDNACPMCRRELPLI